MWVEFLVGSRLALRVFLRFHRFSLIHKNQHIQLLIRSGWRVRSLNIKVRLTPKYYFRLNYSLHLFETHCAFLPPFSPNLDFLQAVKVKKSGHHLFHDRASKGYGSIPGLMSQTILHAYLQRLNTMQMSLLRQPKNRPMPLTSSVVQQVMARFLTFTAYKKSQDLVLKGAVRFKQVQRFI